MGGRFARVLLVVFAGLIFYPCFAQSPIRAAGSVSSLNVSLAPTDQADFDSCSRQGISGYALGLDLHYAGVEPLRGYVVVLRFRTVTSPNVEQYQTDRRLLHPNRPLITSGTTWHSSVCGLPMDVNLSDVNTSVDLLAFADGSTSGPASVRESNQVAGMFAGMNLVTRKNDTERAYLTPTSVTPPGNAVPIEQVGNSLPVRFTALVNREESGQAFLVVNGTNIGGISIIGYEYKLSFFDHATGAFVKSVTTKLLATEGAPDYLLPGATWASGGRKLPASSDGDLDKYSVTLDAVVLSDGRTLGPRRSREADELLGMVEGMQIANSLPPSMR